MEGFWGLFRKEIEAQGGLAQAEGKEEVCEKGLEIGVGDRGDVDSLARVERREKLVDTRANDWDELVDI